MKAIRLKLNSSRGASMMMALMFLLCALVLGAVALTAASVNAGRTERNRNEQQLYYSLKSAASLIEADMGTASFTSYTTERSTQTWTLRDLGGNNMVGSFSEPVTLESSSFTVGSDSKLLYTQKNEIISFYSGEAPIGIEMTKVLPFSISAGDDTPQVNGTLTLIKGGKRDYTVVFDLYVGNGADKRGEMTLSFTPNLEKNLERTEATENNVHTVVTTDSTTVTWNEPNVSEGGDV